MAGKNFCELCGEAGLSRRLVPFLINTEEAILVCENPECVFPLGSPRVSNFIVSRKTAEVSNSKRKKKKKVLHDEPQCTESPQNHPSIKRKHNPENFLQWQNVDALCWLDSTLSLLVHNWSLKQITDSMTSSTLLKILLKKYGDAQNLPKSDMTSALGILEDVRQDVWTYLHPKMKCSLGVNDSPVFALPLLLRDNELISKKCLQEYTWEYKCSACGFTEKNRNKKHVVTLPNTPKDFHPQQSTFRRPCPMCGSTEQFSIISYESMPEVVMLHFVEGLKSTDYLDYKLVHQDIRYELTQFLQYSRNPDHFVCWTKEHYGSRWLEMDDLKPSICSWSCDLPRVPPSEIHIIVFQKVTTHLITSNNCTANENNTCLPRALKELNNNITERTREDTIVNTPLSPTPSCQHTSISTPADSTPSADSLFKVTLKRLSSNMKFQPSFAKKRHCQFQPYIPRKERASLPNPANHPDPIAHELFDSQSDSGYSSPSSVSSCGSASSGQTGLTTLTELEPKGIENKESPMEGDDTKLADELEKLLPKCLLLSDNQRMISDKEVAFTLDLAMAETKDISDEQDKFIQSLFDT